MNKYLFYQISYSVTDPSFEDTNRYPYFYTTVPDDHFINKVRQDLLEHFGWKRVGIFSVEDEYHVSVSNKIDILNISTIQSIKFNLQGLLDWVHCVFVRQCNGHVQSVNSFFT